MFVATRVSDIDNCHPDCEGTSGSSAGNTTSISHSDLEQPHGKGGSLIAALVSMAGSDDGDNFRKMTPKSGSALGKDTAHYYRQKHPLIDFVEYHLHPTFPRPRRRKGIHLLVSTRRILGRV